MVWAIVRVQYLGVVVAGMILLAAIAVPGHADDNPLELTFVVMDLDNRVLLAEIIAGDWEKIGIETDLEPVTLEIWWVKAPEGDYNLLSLGERTEGASGSLAGYAGYLQNYYRSPKGTACYLCAPSTPEFNSTASQFEASDNQTERLQLVQDMQWLWHKNPPHIPLVSWEPVMGVVIAVAQITSYI